MTTTEWLDEVLAGKVVVNIGQLDKPTTRALDKMVRAGVIRKWRGKWFPVSGAAWGLGPDKTCWGI